MNADILNAALAFAEGVGLVLSPCILPILPIMLAASLDGGKKRPLGIIAGFIIAFTGFALLSRQILGALHADPQIVRNAALAFLMLFGVVMLSQKLSDKLIGATQGLANAGQSLTARWDKSNGFWGGTAVGALIGLIWTPCAGPIMAAAVVQIIEAKTSGQAVTTVIMFAIGAGLPMLAIALAGRQIMSRFSFLKTHSHAVRRALGIIIIAAALFIYSGADVRLLASSPAMPAATTAQNKNNADGKLENPLPQPYPAPAIAPGQWFNSPPLRIADLRGKVVLVDFWTYSCINCVRTLPYIEAWNEKYRDKGLVIIGIHSPEFAFEKDPVNVQAALTKDGITYPVVLDNDLQSWSNFNNEYWPAHYLIDKNGRVVYTHFGEGDYGVTEHNIRVLLGLDTAKGAISTPALSSMDMDHANAPRTPETYLGSNRAERYAGTPALQPDAVTAYAMPASLPVNNWALSGSWKVEGQKITATQAHAALRLHFHARHVFLVMGTDGGKPVRASIMLDGAPIGSSAGKDVKNGVVTVGNHALYELVSLDADRDGQIDITAAAPGLELYAFTFGG
ncbi:MAG: cytochrome c biogenesis protein DipZ [Alphaproteobacteria bacterium]|nr:cytochrome c biogenesis protein DipZ [Alphaproteobacteria bacterium]